MWPESWTAVERGGSGGERGDVDRGHETGTRWRLVAEDRVVRGGRKEGKGRTRSVNPMRATSDWVALEYELAQRHWMPVSLVVVVASRVDARVCSDEDDYSALWW